MFLLVKFVKLVDISKLYPRMARINMKNTKERKISEY